MIVLGSLELDGLASNLVWSDRYAWSSVSQQTRRTLGGGLVVFPVQLIAGRPITLETLDDQGWMTTEQADALQAMASQSGGVFPLMIFGESYTVMFRHEDPPALQLTPLVARGMPEEGDFFTGTIKLITL